MIDKILTRGRTPLPTLGIEREALRVHGPFNSVAELGADESEVGWESTMFADPAAVLATAVQRDSFALDEALNYRTQRLVPLMGSEAEANFLNKWVPEHLGPTAGHWFIPQAPLGPLLQSRQRSGKDARRIDFLFCHPLAKAPLAIEIDGPQHRDAARVDEERDRLLRSVGIDVVRISTTELSVGSGPGLENVSRRLSYLFADRGPPRSQQRHGALAMDCATAAKVQFAVAGALFRGWLRPLRPWQIRLKGARSPSAAGVVDLLEMLKTIDVIYGARSSPSRCSVALDDGNTWSWSISGSESEGPSQENGVAESSDDLTIAVETSCGPFHNTHSDGDPDCIIRSTHLPVTLASRPKLPGKGHRQANTNNYRTGGPIHRALRLFLRHVFRKRDFLEGQGRALLNVLRKIDSIVLLPTGGGKSIIYQLAGLLIPGVTIVVDPLVALMEDQLEGLESYGIDKTVAIFLEARVHQERKIGLVEQGQFQFVFLSPERLQSPRFRDAIQGLTEKYPVNLAVIDEAHCVSEWGHDFRPAYLSLANSLRSFRSSEDSVSPTLLALTGTASRAVLRDMIRDLEIDRNNSDALIRPESFDRKEIKFRIIRTTPNYAAAKLRSELQRLPMVCGLPTTEYYKPRGRKTNSGIVFVPTVRGPTGIMDVLDHVRKATPAEVTCYSGKDPASDANPNWTKQKHQNARDFKKNEMPILVATKAYGMGIDKPNIRYTIHYGVPSSLEQFYQEAGRAGRDRMEAYSTIILAELSKIRSDRLLDPDLELESLRQMHLEASRNLSSRDDITRALFFHLNGFNGTDRETASIGYLIESIFDKPSEVPIRLPFGAEREPLEKAIYRLYKIGFVRDYTVDFGSRVFEITMNQFEFTRIRTQILDYVRYVAPGKLRSIRRRIDSIDAKEGSQVLIGLATVFIEFTYDEIERARRRAIQEAILLARQAKSDFGIRKRLLDYLQEGVGFEKLDDLLQREEVDLQEWIDIAEKVGNAIEAGGFRGLCIRALESSPDHPGLLLTRGIVETMCSDYYWNAASTSIARAITVGIEKYDITTDHIEDVVNGLFDSSLMRHFGPDAESAAGTAQLEPALVMALLDVSSNPKHPFAVTIAVTLGTRSRNPETQAILQAYSLDQLLQSLEGVAKATVHTLNSCAMAHRSRDAARIHLGHTDNG
ncbi:MAG: RecQ family ATP-dependent DNA helicase [Bryobacterales bacterium]|nr:RecQ family ATP-dependent DNA helicase [Bryobacterales bacterium]